MKRYPFDYDHSQPFLKQVGEWVADVFYDILPEAGFEEGERGMVDMAVAGAVRPFGRSR